MSHIIILKEAAEAVVDGTDAGSQLERRIADSYYSGQELVTAEGLIESLETAATDAKEVLNTATTNIKNFIG